MKPLTKKYIFECKLKGIPVDLRDVSTRSEWKKALNLLVDAGIFRFDESSIDRPAGIRYDILYPIMGHFTEHENLPYHEKTMVPGEMMSIPHDILCRK